MVEKSEKSFNNTPNAVNTVTVGCDCPICNLEPFDSGVGEYSKDDMNATFQMLVGEATTPALAKQKHLDATSEDHAKEAFAISSAIFNRARYDKMLMEKKHRPAPVVWGFLSDGTPLGVAKSGKVVAYTSGHYKILFAQAKKNGDVGKGKPYCDWLVILKDQAERAAKNPSERDAYTEWRTHDAKKTGRTRILNTDLWEKKIDYPELMTQRPTLVSQEMFKV
jgi:hypothetical protein